MTKLEYYSVVVANKPGKGKHVLSALKEAGVNFVAIWGYPVGKGKAKIDLVAEDAAGLKKAAKKLKIEPSTSPVKIMWARWRKCWRNWRRRKSTSTRCRPSALATGALARWFR
jgi:hypothetical protein